MTRHTRAYFRPRTLEEAWEIGRAHPGARWLAGGTDLLVHADWPETIVSLRGVADLGGIETGPVTRIGALTSIGEIAGHAGIRERFPALADAAGRIGSVQIRNVATLGGNLCRAAPCADSAPPLLVHEANVEIVSPEASRETALDGFFCGPGETCLEPGEVLAGVKIPAPPPGARSLFLKKGRVFMDLSLASVAMLLQLEDGVCRRVRLAAGSVAPTPVRLVGAEALLEGEPPLDATIDAAAEAAAQEVAPIDDLRASAGYRRRIVAAFVGRGLRRLREECA